MIRVLPVIDLQGPHVVRGIGGERHAYRPIESRLVADPQPASVARAFVSAGFAEAYVADLDAIATGNPRLAIYQALLDTGLGLWLDAGLREARQSEPLIEFAQQRGLTLIAGSETLTEPALLDVLLARLGPDQVVFSLDMKHGSPRCGYPPWQTLAPLAIVERAIARGVRRCLLLDLADVGQHQGIGTLSLCRALRELPTNTARGGLEIAAGGGVRSLDDLQAMQTAGCHVALVASALHDGRLTPAMLGLASNG